MSKNNVWTRFVKQAAGERRVTPARRPAARLQLLSLEDRAVPAATIQFTTGAETVNASTGTFSIPVTLTGTPTGGTSNESTYATGFGSPTQMAFDSSGNLFVGDDEASSSSSPTGNVFKVTPSGVVSTFATGFEINNGLAIDASNNVYVANL